jgi:putative hydrolase of HD superfamily
METLDALLSLLALDRLPRSGWLLAGIPVPESVAAHSLGTAFVALALGPRVEPALDVERTVVLAVLHDATEALLTDLPRTAVEYLPDGAKARAEERAAERLLAPLSALASEREAEYRARSTRESRFVALCDKLHLGVRWLGYLSAGARGLDSFRRNLDELDCREFPACAELRRAILGAADLLRAAR